MKAPINIEFEATKIVQPSDLASSYGSGRADVFATPAMIAFMEKTCNEWFSQYLEEGYISVGAAINIRHLRPTPVGREVRCVASYLGEQDKLHKFEMKVYDGEKLLGDGTQLRGVVHREKFEINSKK